MSMSPLEQVVVEGNEKADELAKDGRMMVGGQMAELRAE